jgi:hypothetical protein
MALGDVIKPAASVLQPLARVNVIGPRLAMAQALAAYLMAQEFRVDGGSDVRDRVFALLGVTHVWPGPEVVISYPSASIVETAGTDHVGVALAPFPLEETWGRFDDRIGLQVRTTDDAAGVTCLWKEGQASTLFQVDFWTDTEPDRQAIEAALPALFNPHDGQAGVVVEGPELYYSRSCRFTLLSTKSDDSATSAGRGERRLRCSVRSECDIVSLRMATVSATPVVTVEVDPVAEEE